jgi:hypothetical protein
MDWSKEHIAPSGIDMYLSNWCCCVSDKDVAAQPRDDFFCFTDQIFGQSLFHPEIFLGPSFRKVMVTSAGQ